MNKKLTSLPIKKIRFYLMTLNEPTRVKLAVLFAVKDALGSDYLQKLKIKRVSRIGENFFEVHISSNNEEAAGLFESMKKSIERTAQYFLECNVRITIER